MLQNMCATFARQWRRDRKRRVTEHYKAILEKILWGAGAWTDESGFTVKVDFLNPDIGPLVIEYTSNK
jgi:hypothetical protein